MSRQEDFEKAAMDYCEDHSHCIYFEFGAEHGYQYAQTHPNWISVEDELPRVGFGVLCYSPDHDDILKCALQKDGSWYCPEYCCTFNVTHWMQRPQPPRKEDKICTQCKK